MSMSHVVLGLIICGFVVLILGITFIGTIVDARLARAATEILNTTTHHNAIVASMIDGLIVIDDNGIIETTFM